LAETFIESAIWFTRAGVELRRTISESFLAWGLEARARRGNTV